MNKQNKQLLQQMERAQQRIKYPSLPDHAVALTNWQDNSANALTKSIIKDMKGSSKKEITLAIHKANPNFNRTQLAEQLGVTRRTIINYLNEEK